MGQMQNNWGKSHASTLGKPKEHTREATNSIPEPASQKILNIFPKSGVFVGAHRRSSFASSRDAGAPRDADEFHQFSDGLSRALHAARPGGRTADVAGRRAVGLARGSASVPAGVCCEEAHITIGSNMGKQVDIYL